MRIEQAGSRSPFGVRHKQEEGEREKQEGGPISEGVFDRIGICGAFRGPFTLQIS